MIKIDTLHFKEIKLIFSLRKVSKKAGTVISLQKAIYFSFRLSFGSLRITDKKIDFILEAFFAIHLIPTCQSSNEPTIGTNSFSLSGCKFSTLSIVKNSCDIHGIKSNLSILPLKLNFFLLLNCCTKTIL